MQSLVKIYLCISILCFSLGTWQVFRLQNKEDMIHAIDNMLKENYKNIDTITNTTTNFQRVILHGQYDCKKTIFMYRALNGIDGYDTYMLYIHSHGNTMVNRGWIPRSSSKDICLQSNLIKGILRTNLKRPTFSVINNDLINNEWFYYDREEIMHYLKIHNMTHYLIQDSIENNIFKIDKFTPNIPNNHKQYIFTWYSLMIISLIFVMRIYYRKPTL